MYADQTPTYAPTTELCGAPPTTASADAPLAENQHRSQNPPSPARSAAARRNGALSRGPTTEAGKRRSRGNRLRHGMAGNGTVLPEQIRAAYLTEVELYQKDLRPQNHHEFRLVERAALATTRWLLILRADIERTTERARNAPAAWKSARRADVVQWIPALQHDSKADPAEAIIHLRQTALGCKRLAEAHTPIIYALQLPAALTSDLTKRLMRLHGHPRGHARNDDPRHIRALVFLVDAINASANPYGLDVTAKAYGLSLDELQQSLPTADEAREQLIAQLHAARTALRLRARRLARELDRPARAGITDTALFDPSPEGFLMNRYLVDANRIAHSAIQQFTHLRKQAQSSDHTK